MAHVITSHGPSLTILQLTDALTKLAELRNSPAAGASFGAPVPGTGAAAQPSWPDVCSAILSVVESRLGDSLQFTSSAAQAAPVPSVAILEPPAQPPGTGAGADLPTQGSVPDPSPVASDSQQAGAPCEHSSLEQGSGALATSESGGWSHGKVLELGHALTCSGIYSSAVFGHCASVMDLESLKPHQLAQLINGCSAAAVKLRKSWLKRFGAAVSLSLHHGRWPSASPVLGVEVYRINVAGLLCSGWLSSSIVFPMHVGFCGLLVQCRC